MMLIKYFQVLLVVFAGSYLSHILMCDFNRRLRAYVMTEKLDPAKLTQFLGWIERLIYAFLFVLGEEFYTYIAAFFAIKIAHRLVSFSKVETPKELQVVGERRNIYFLCNILSLFISILLIGLPAKWVLGGPVISESLLVNHLTIIQGKNNMELTIDGLLTLYSIFLVFVVFCFQEVNNKMREAQDRFRKWCEGRKDKFVQVGVSQNGQKIMKQALEILEINWENEAWLEKDLIFHLYNLKLKIKEAKKKIEEKNATVELAFKEINEDACNDYFDYIYQCLLYKNKSKLLAAILFLLLVVVGIDNDPMIVYLYAGILMLSAFAMLYGPKFDFINNPISKRKNELSKEEIDEVEKLKRLAKEI